MTRLSLEQAVALALRESPTVRAKQHEYRATQAQEITAGLRPNPTTSYTGDRLGSSSVDAQRTYRETSLEHLRALGAYWGALYQLEAAVGDHAVNP